MKIRHYIGALLLTAAAAAAFTSCQDDVDAPGLDVPVATLQPNTTIADLKAEYWNDAANYIDTVGLLSADSHVVIAGRVISSDASGNIYKSLVIQDATGALAMSINANSLYNQYRIGQEIVVDVTDMYIGKYSTLQQLGFPDYSAGYGWQATFMPLEFFQRHIELNGLPEPSKVDTLLVAIPQLSNDAATLRRYQSQLVRLNNVRFKEGGEVSFCTAHKENTNRTLVDENGNELIVRTSGYANFWSTKLPAENGDVVGILSSYLSSGTVKWQLLLRSTADLLNFGNPTLPKGTETNPYDVLDAVAAHSTSSSISGWFTGYIVGAPKAGVTEITSADDIQWSADEEGGMFLVDNTIIVGQTPDARSLADVIAVSLADGSAFQTCGNLLDHPDNIGRQLWVKGVSSSLLGIAAVGENNGSASSFRIEGVEIPDTPGETVPDGNGSADSPYSAGQVNAMGKDANVPGQWVKGYIVGWVDSKIQNYADENNCNFSVPATVATNVLLASSASEKDFSKCVCVNLPTGAIRSAINLLDNPSNLGRLVSVKGDILKYFNVPGVRNLTEYKFDGESGGGDEPGTDPVTSLDESFSAGSKPAGWNVSNVSGNKDWFFGNYGGRTFAACSAYNGTAGASGFESWLVTPAINMSGVESKTLSFESMVGYSGNGSLEVYVLTSADPATATRTRLNANIPQPTGQWGDWTASGDISLASFSGTIYIGFRYQAAAGSGYTTYRVTDVKLGQGGGGGGENPPVSGNSADLNTLTANSSYGTYTTADGWVAVNCAVQTGGSSDKNPMFSCIGSDDVRAVCLNGKAGSEGSLTSPTLTGGIKTLSFKFGFMFSEGSAVPKFTVNIKQNGAVVKTTTFECTNTTKFDVQNFTMDCNVTGDFSIEILNDAAGAQTTNKERISIWDITWSN